MSSNILIILASFLSTVIKISLGNQTDYSFEFVTRSEWNARSPKEVTPLKIPVPLVVIHHTSTTSRCYNREACIEAVREIQNLHMDDFGWWDIAYHFCVGSDGVVYEGRGWETLGAHSMHVNKYSIGITLIGNWTTEVPPKQQLDTVKALIEAGVKLKYVQPTYSLVAHRDVRHTQCPGDALYAEVQTWAHYKGDNYKSIQ